MNLMEGLFYEMNRCRELLKEYEAIGPMGTFGATLLRLNIKLAEDAIKENDVVKMIHVYSDLKEAK